ncbi:unnamed protein product [Parajaminaea phylloscopi]
MAPPSDAPGPHKNLIGHRISDGRLELVSVLGLGAYGVVYLARDLAHPNHQNTSFASSSATHAPPRNLAGSNGSAASGYYAVKCLSKVGLDDRQRCFQRREIMLHTIASNHPSVVTLHRVIDNPDDPCVYVILDYCPDGDLFSMITEHQRYLVAQPRSYEYLEEAAIEAATAAKVDPRAYVAKHRDALRLRAEQERAHYLAERAAMDSMIKKVFCQILDAVEFCHSYGIYHRDLKPENILCLQGGAKVVLADFGLATGEKTSSDFGCGSTFYMGPECQGGITTRVSEYNTAANDVWSLGVILVNLMCGRNPWKQACTADETFREYLRRPDFLMDILPISEEANAILKRIFTVRAEWRVSTQDLRKMVLSVGSFTVTDEEMKVREHQACSAAAQARAAQKAAAAAAAAATAAAKQRSLAERYMAQQQQQQHLQQQFYRRQHQHLLLQQEQHLASRGIKSPIRVHNSLYADAYADAADDTSACELEDDFIGGEPEDCVSEADVDVEEHDDDGQWSGDSERSSGSRWVSSTSVNLHSFSSSSRGRSSSSSSVPTSPESATAPVPKGASSMAPPPRPPRRSLGQQHDLRRRFVEDECDEDDHLDMPQSYDCSSSRSGDSCSSRRSSVSYAGFPPTPRSAAQATFFLPTDEVDGDVAPVHPSSHHAHHRRDHQHLDVHTRLGALAIKADAVAAIEAKGRAVPVSLDIAAAAGRVLSPDSFADPERRLLC